MYKLGHFENFWQESHKSLPYRREQFNNTEDIDLWRSQGYTNQHFTGLMFDMKNSMPSWAERFFTLFDGDNVGVSFYRMDTCNILPYHRDTYETYRRVFNISDPNKIWRAVIFLDEWSPGHIFEIEDRPLTKWRSGDYVLWNWDSPHMAANLGLTPRYTAQITFTDV